METSDGRRAGRGTARGPAHRRSRAVDRPRVAVIHSNAGYLTGLRLPLLRHLGRRADVVALAPRLEPWHVGVLEDAGVEGRSFRLAPTGLNPVRDALDTIQLARMLRSMAPDVVITNTIKPVIFGTFAAWLAGISRRYALVSGLGYAFTDVGAPAGRRKRVVRMLTAFLYRRAFALNDRVIFQNADDLREFVDAGICPRSKATLVDGSGIDVDAYRPTLLEPRPTFVMVSRLLREKGVMDYLEAARTVKARIPEASFLLVGGADGNPTALADRDLRGFIDDGTVEWVGAVRDVRPSLARASIFVLPSYREGLPRSTLEAMAAGLAVITTDVPGCRETVRDGINGLLVPVRDVDALAAAMEEVARDLPRVETMGNASRAMAEARFDIARIHRQMDEILDLSTQDAALG